MSVPGLSENSLMADNEEKPRLFSEYFISKSSDSRHYLKSEYFETDWYYKFPDILSDSSEEQYVEKYWNIILLQDLSENFRAGSDDMIMAEYNSAMEIIEFRKMFRNMSDSEEKTCIYFKVIRGANDKISLEQANYDVFEWEWRMEDIQLDREFADMISKAIAETADRR